MKLSLPDGSLRDSGKERSENIPPRGNRQPRGVPKNYTTRGRKSQEENELKNAQKIKSHFVKIDY